ncbi:LysR family transcriptional regulator [Variovorax sp. LG9.2]|uniref:LysR family transcriptional regulator n=1 Tax=Variovorax sp. LG9.2 TaxID=3048626 RepID=UPI002B221AF6|nr:LysR family transcriptional regulator [Variovorax sp. LG9.2]MEB0056213.1 LysR family transcriptional regulator [Variovorax sp. LG9.2]
MDKLRALQYFAAAAAEKSLSSAARRLGVSVTAIAKLINSLEKSLGAKLFDRTSRGLTLTAEGTRYLDACRPALMQLDQADERLRESTLRPKGTVVIGVQHVIARGCLTAALPHFHVRYPDIEIDIRDFQRVTDEQIIGVDVMMVLGWPQAEDMVLNQIAAGRFLVVASPAYWAEHGRPRRPRDLERHVCLPIRSVDGSVMDTWSFTRGAEQESVHIRGWLTTSNAHRDLVIELALAGHGVIRILDWANLPELACGSLVRALEDWESTEAPPVNLLYRPSVRRIPRVRLFIDFATELFREIAQKRGEDVIGTGRPNWLRRH